MKLMKTTAKVVMVFLLFIATIQLSLNKINYKNQQITIKERDRGVMKHESMEDEEVEDREEIQEGIDDPYQEVPKDLQNPEMPIFYCQELPQEILDKVNGSSWREEAPVPLEELSYVIVTHWGFDEKEHIGEIIIHKNVAEEIVEIFRELYNERFPIEKIKLIDEYHADDHLSMQDNNTSAFCFRKIEGTNTISKHGYGVAIDINPLQNPYIKGEIIQPLAGKDYLDRSDVRKGMILKGDSCYKAFTSRGWSWGGDWKTVTDYQHFEKDISSYE